MRLLVVSQHFWPETFGINSLVKSLVREGVHVTVLTGQPNYPEGRVFPGYVPWRVRRETACGAEVVRAPLVPRGQRSAVRLAANYLSFVAIASSLAPWLLRRRPFDAVFVYATSPVLQAIPAILLARLRMVPLVLWVQDLWPESLVVTGYVRNPAVLRAVGRVVTWIYRRCDSILVQSEAFREPVAALAGGDARIGYYPNAVDDEPPAEPCSAAGQALASRVRERFSVVFAGNLGAAQSLETIVEAARLLRDCAGILQIVLVGSGSRSEWVAQEAVRLGLHNLVLAGRLPPSDMPEVFRAAAALLVTLRPDPAMSRTVPSKVQAYLAAGRPIVAALDGEGARLVRESGAGVVVRPGDAPALAAAIAELHAMDAAAREAMGANGRSRFVAEFDLRQRTSELVAHLAALRAEKERKR